MGVSDRDGGYYAIKGFVFQFDKTIREAISNRTALVYVEQVQDIAVEQYYIQVKHKESQVYAPSKIRHAVCQLIYEFKKSPKNKYRLFCYFKDQPKQVLCLSVDEIDKILGREKNKFTVEIKTKFSKKFELEFSENFEQQFKDLIDEIKKSFSLKSAEEAVMYHSAFRAAVMSASIDKSRAKRIVSFELFQSLQHANEALTFNIAYAKYLTKGKYLTYIKKEYFTHKKINVLDHERLFVIYIDAQISDNNIIQAITNIKNRYYIQDNSGAPYICLIGIPSDRALAIKQKLWDLNIYFSDGTHFKDDKFRLKSLTETYHKVPGNKTKCKLVDETQLDLVLSSHQFDEIFEFLGSDHAGYALKKNVTKSFYLPQTRDILSVIL